MARKHNVGVTISAKDLASGVIKKVSARTVALGVAVGNLASKMISGAVNGVRRWIDEALEAERANVMLDAALRGTGQYTDALSRKMKDLAGAIQDETGASDEAVKANIAMLTTMGVTTDKMGEAARAVQALSALNFEGSQAAKAVALAMEGNMLGFQRMIPALRNAKTEAEKVAAVNKVLAAGYEQQKANLNTVGGAWEALKGRIGDAREDIIGAVFEGLKLGQTFDSMQAAVGRFLQSDTFKDFTERLKSGASYVKQIIEAMGTDGGTKEVLAAMANVILAALKDGGEYVASKINNALTGTPRKLNEYVKRAHEIPSDLWGGIVKTFGNRMMGGSLNDMWREFGEHLARAKQRWAEPIEIDTGGNRTGGNLDAALSELTAVIERRTKTVQDTGDAQETLHDRAEDENELASKILESENNRLEVSERAFLSEKAAAERDKKILEKKNKKAEYEEKLASLAEEIKSTEDAIYAAADRERSAREEIATAEEKRAEMLKQSISDWIAAQQEEEKGQEAIEKQNAKDRKRAGRLRDKQDRGVRLSERDRDWLNKFDRRDLELREGGPLNAEAMAAQARDQQIAWQKNIEELQRKQTAVTEEIRDYLKEALEVQ